MLSPAGLPPRQSVKGYRNFREGYDARRILLTAGARRFSLPQRRSSPPSTGWWAFTVCLPFWGTLRVPLCLWGLLAPIPRRKLLKKLEQNLYVVVLGVLS